MITTLNKIDEWLEENRPEYLLDLRPPATDAQLDALAAQFNLPLPEGFRTLYRWHDGQNPRTFESLAGNRMFMALKVIAETKTELDGMIGHDFEDPEFWRREWIPFLSDGGGNYTVLDLSPEGNGRLLDFYHDDELRKPVNASVDEWIAELAESMEDGSYEVI